MKRFVARQQTLGRFTTWNVYDTEKQSWPSVISGRRVRTGMETREEAEREADRLNGGGK